MASTSIPCHESFGTVPPMMMMTTTTTTNPSNRNKSPLSTATATANTINNNNNNNNNNRHNSSRLWARLGLAEPHQLKEDIFQASQYNQGFQKPPTLQQQQQAQHQKPDTLPLASLSMEEKKDSDDDDDNNGSAATTSSTALTLSEHDDDDNDARPKPRVHRWNIDFCRTTMSSFSKYLQYFAQRSQAALQQQKQQQQLKQHALPATSSVASSSSSSQDTTAVKHHHDDDDEYDLQDLQLMQQLILSSETTSRAFKALLRCQYPTPELADLVRELERTLGQIVLVTRATSPLNNNNSSVGHRLAFTDEVSLRLLEANSKAGNLGRAMALLELRKQYQYRPRRNEFEFAVTSLQAAGLQYRVGTTTTSKNVYRSRIQQELITPMWVDDPTRWLDAILLNMKERNATLDLELANHMIRCFSTTGKSAKALHFFYQVYETYEPVTTDEAIAAGGSSTPTIESAPASSDAPAGATSDENNSLRRRVRIRMNPPPPYYKVPSMAKTAKVPFWIPQAPRRNSNANKTNNTISPSAAAVAAAEVGTTHRVVKKLRADLELHPDFANGLTAAFEFCDSLTMGVAGHDPIVLDVNSYNLLLSACVNHGALFRALSVLRETMPRQGVMPNIVSYNTVLVGLARVGDVTTMMDLWVELQSTTHLEMAPNTIRYMVEGMLNRGDVSGATSFVQAAFNQHVVLPPYSMHLKILEMALGLDLVYEARRHVQFLQQMWKWQPNGYHTPRQVRLVRMQQRQPKLSKAALQQLFHYFGHNLPESEFY